MVIDDLDLFRIAILPAKANAILFVDSNTVLTTPVATQSLRPIARRNAEFDQIDNAIELI